MREDGLDSRRGWLIVGAAVVSMFVVFGVGYSFGAFFESITAEFGSGSGATAVVFAITISLSFMLAPFTGGLADRIGPSRVALVAAIALALGLGLTTIVPSIWLAYLTYGLGVGIAIGCGYVPMVAAVSGWFVDKRALALGIAVAGIGLGTLFANPLAAALIDTTSWRTAFLIFAGVGSAALLAVSAVIRPGPAWVPAPRRRRLTELLALREFRLLYISLILTSLGLYVPVLFLPSYAEDHGHSALAGAVLVGLIGGASVLGRLGLGGLGDRFGSLRLFRASVATMGAAPILWLISDGRYAVLVGFVVIFGFAYGGFIALSPSVVADRFGVEGLGGVLGAWYTAAGLGSLFGPPLFGEMIDRVAMSPTIVAAAVSIGLGAATLFAIRPSDRAERHATS